MIEKDRERKTPPPVRPYISRDKAIELLSRFFSEDGDTLDPDISDALQFSIGDMRMVKNAHHATNDLRD